ncbi:hypothetical protein VP01_1407g3 [Puccinia sorghi]|uniref:Uncharacterized protein n=1 Tax=Puccinia sorghi TaxID=27349 RepID=A0A0L6VL26_9BASI|nr:hypothetical protein VP01_1407g3 [Puccinia sorghi]
MTWIACSNVPAIITSPHFRLSYATSQNILDEYKRFAARNPDVEFTLSKVAQVLYEAQRICIPQKPNKKISSQVSGQDTISSVVAFRAPLAMNLKEVHINANTPFIKPQMNFNRLLPIKGLPFGMMGGDLWLLGLLHGIETATGMSTPK